MEKIKFNNRPNEYDGKGYFISRSVSLDGIVFVMKPDGIYVLTVKRSNMMDNAGKWCLPCGYLDWDESVYDGMLREVYEETSFFIPMYEGYIIFDNNKQPFFVKSDPNTPRQNVALAFINIIDFRQSKEEYLRFMNDVESYTCKEVSEIKWLNINDVGKKEWAFNHNQLISQGLIFYHEKRT